MKDSYKQLCFLIASANFREEELLDFATTLKELSPSEFASEVSSARRAISDSSRKYHAEEGEKDRKIGSSTKNLEEKVVQLLVINAGLTKGAAAAALLNAINIKHPEISVPNFRNLAFGEWIRKITKYISPSEILHLASTIRNQHVHDKNSDWLLK